MASDFDQKNDKKDTTYAQVDTGIQCEDDEKEMAEA